MELLALADDEAICLFMIKMATSALLICIQDGERDVPDPSNAVRELDENACIRASLFWEESAAGKQERRATRRRGRRVEQRR